MPKAENLGTVPELRLLMSIEKKCRAADVAPNAYCALYRARKPFGPTCSTASCIRRENWSNENPSGVRVLSGYLQATVRQTTRS